jgi:hypothetical protein
MNTLSMLYKPYESRAFFNKWTGFWELEFESKEIGDLDGYDQLTKEDLETMRDNAKRLYDAINGALSDNT